VTTLTFPRRQPRGSQAVSNAIVGAGRVIGWVRRRSALLPGLAGAGMVSYAAALWHLPAGIAAGGVFLLAMDRQIRISGGE
jgi:hypothetical protein